MGRDANTHALLGNKLGPRIAQLVAQAMSEHLRQSTRHRVNIGKHAAIEFFKTITDERDTHASPLLDMWLGHNSTPDELEHLLRFIHGGQGELAGLLTHGALSQAIGMGMGAGIANLLAPANQTIMHVAPFQLIGAGEAASAASAGIISVDEARNLARFSGLREPYTDILIEGGHTWPGLSELLDLWRRGDIDEPFVRRALRRGGITDEAINHLEQLRQVLLSPEDLALMVLKGIVTEQDAADEATKQGVDHQRFSRLVLANGEPPGPEQLGEAFRRGYIDRARFEHGIRQSRIRDEWVDVLLDLRFTPASPADALRGVVQGHLDSARGKRIAEEGGLRPEDWDWLEQTEGNPPGTMQMIDLWRRGHATQQQVEQAIREGRTKNKYIGNLLNLKRVLPAERQIVSMLTKGAIAESEAARLLHERGYDDTVVKGFLHEATNSQVTREKQLARADILELYYDHAIDETEALRLLKALGFTGHTAQLVLSITDLRRAKALTQAAMSPIKSAYVARHISAAEASAELDQLGIPHKQRDLALHLWAVDRASHKKLLTEAQIVRANSMGLLSDATAEEELQGQGYSQRDARILLDMERGRTQPAP